MKLGIVPLLKGDIVNNIQVVAHTSFLGTTGFSSHSQNFFSRLNKYIPTRIRNYSYDSDLSKYSKEAANLLES